MFTQCDLQLLFYRNPDFFIKIKTSFIFALSQIFHIIYLCITHQKMFLTHAYVFTYRRTNELKFSSYDCVFCFTADVQFEFLYCILWLTVGQLDVKFSVQYKSNFKLMCLM